MSLLGKVTGLAARYVVASDPVINVVDKTILKLEESEKKKRAKLFEKEPGTEILVLERQYTKHRRRAGYKSLVAKFGIYGNNQELKYYFQDKHLSRNRRIVVIGADGKSVGSLTIRSLALHKYISGNPPPISFTIDIYGNKLGTIKSKGSSAIRKYEIGFNGWLIYSNASRGDYSVVSREEVIAQIFKKGDAYV